MDKDLAPESVDWAGALRHRPLTVETAAAATSNTAR